MRSIAEFIMRGRMQATLAVAIMVIPGLFWVGAAIASFVLLRKGVSQALQISVIGLVIALICWYFERPSPLLVLVGALFLAHILRITVSWAYVLVASVLIAVVCYWWFYLYPTGEMLKMTAMAISQFPEMLQQAYNITPKQSADMVKVMAPIFIPLVYGVGIQVFCIVSLIVARYWQALLYNPGGFKEEFYQLRMPIGITTILVIGMLIIPNLYDSQAVLMFACSIPLLITGLALIHSFFAKIQMSFAIVIFYIMLVFAFPVFCPLLVMLAIVDSFLNLRNMSSKKTG